MTEGQVIGRTKGADRATLVAAGIVAALLLAALICPLVHDGELWGAMLHGARTLVVVATAAMAIALLVGGFLGAAAGWYGGQWEGFLGRILEALGAFPGIALVALASAMDRGFSIRSLIVALALVRLPEVARIVRIELLRLRSEPYVQAAVALGASPLGLITRHIGPQLTGALAHSAMFGAAMLILLQSALSFVGLGAARSAPSWGAVVARQAASSHPLGALVPAAALLATLWALMRLGAAADRGLNRRPARATPLHAATARSR
jgi:peptide/nickel transport system permease protein